MYIYISLDSLQNSLFNNMFYFEKKFINLSYYTRPFSLVAH